MEIKKGDTIPTGWRKDGVQIIGFAHHQGVTIEDKIICRIHDKKHRMFEWAVGTTPKIAKDGSKLIWGSGKYYSTPDNENLGLPEGVVHDDRESISVPGTLAVERNKPLHITEDPEDRKAAVTAFVEEMMAKGKSVDDIDNLFSELKMTAISHAEELAKADGKDLNLGDGRI